MLQLKCSLSRKGNVEIDINLSNRDGRIREQENQSTRLDKKIDNLIDDMHDSFKQISGYFGVLEQQIDEVRANLAEVKTEMTAMEKRIRSEMATKQDIAEIRTEMATRQDITEIRAEMATRQDIADTKTEIAEIERHLRVDMLANITDMKERMAEVGKDIHSDIKELIVALDPRRASQ